MSARVLSAMIVLLFWAGCASPTPSVSPTSSVAPTPSAPPTSSTCPNGYYMCEWLPTSTVPYAALFHIKESYPAQTTELEDFPLPKGWIMSEKGDLVVIWNTLTGFRWEGTMGWREISLGDCCIGTMPEAYVIKESVTTVVPTIVPTVVLDPTRGPGE